MLTAEISHLQLALGVAIVVVAVNLIWMIGYVVGHNRGYRRGADAVMQSRDNDLYHKLFEQDMEDDS